MFYKKAFLYSLLTILLLIFVIDLYINKFLLAKDKSLLTNISAFTDINSTDELYPIEYINWVRDSSNGLKLRENYNGVIHEVLYKPIDYMICMEVKSNSISKTVLDLKRLQYSGMHYFEYTISLADQTENIFKYNLKEDENLNSRNMYFLFGLPKNIFLISDNDTIPCSMYHFERTYDIAPYVKILAGFKSEKNTSKIELSVSDSVFSFKTLKFSFDADKLNAIPKLKTTNTL